MYSLGKTLEEWLEQCDDDDDKDEDDDHRNRTVGALCPSAAAHHGRHHQQQSHVHGLRELLWGVSMRMTEYDPDRRPTAAEALSLVLSDSHRCYPAAPFYA